MESIAVSKTAEGLKMTRYERALSWALGRHGLPTKEIVRCAGVAAVGAGSVVLAQYGAKVESMAMLQVARASMTLGLASLIFIPPFFYGYRYTRRVMALPEVRNASEARQGRAEGVARLRMVVYLYFSLMGGVHFANAGLGVGNKIFQQVSGAANSVESAVDVVK